jgi:3-hydroxyisobutyrate dehydrogenase-like beta-hydroxyacid dehydrogenase
MKIAVLGLGIIGQIWAKNLIADGLEVKTWNRTPKEDFPGFRTCARQAVEGVDFIIIVVADPPAVQSVLDAIVPSLKPWQIIVQSSTISSVWTKKFAAQVEGAGATFIEAPFTGSKPAAEQRKTVFYVGGKPEEIERARPLLQKLGNTILRIGDTGSASALKLAMNLNIAAVAQALTESLTLARKAGISDETYFEAFHLNAGRSGLSDLKEPYLRSHDYNPLFSVKHMGKDLRLALESAQELGLDLPQTKNLLKQYTAGAAEGWSDEDFIGLIRLLE